MFFRVDERVSQAVGCARRRSDVENKLVAVSIPDDFSGAHLEGPSFHIHKLGADSALAPRELKIAIAKRRDNFLRGFFQKIPCADNRNFIDNILSGKTQNLPLFFFFFLSENNLKNLYAIFVVHIFIGFSPDLVILVV